LIVTADHGVSFRTGENRRRLSENNADEILSVPLFVKLPGQLNGEISDRNVESVDLLPTIADVLHVSVESPIDGESLARAATGLRMHKTFHRDAELLTFPPDFLHGRPLPEVMLRTYEQSRPRNLFQIGPFPELIGRSAEELIEESNVDRGRLELNQNTPNPVVVKDQFLPCYFEAMYRPADPGAEMPPIAVAVHGIIQGIARPSEIPTARGRWEILVPENAVRYGSNEIRFYFVEAEGDTFRLIPCPAAKRSPRVLPMD
jgi:hypothetical protein